MSKLGVESSHDDHDDHEGHDHKRRKRETEHSELHAVDTTVRARHSTTLIFTVVDDSKIGCWLTHHLC